MSSVTEPTPNAARGIDLAPARTFLAARFGDDVGNVTPVGCGEWSTAYAFRRAGRDCVVRFGAHAEDFAKDRLAARYAAPNLPIPAVLEIGEAFGGAYCIAERAFGRFIDDLDGRELRALLPALFATLDAARRIDLPATTGYGPWGTDGVAPYPSWRAFLLSVGDDPPTDRTHGWRARLAASSIGIGPFDEALGHLAALADACPAERHLVHGDLLDFNVLVADGRISAVLDWGCSLYGDFLYDIAWFAYWAPWYPAWAGIDFIGEAAEHSARIGLAVPNFAERLRCCRIHIGLSGLAYQAFKGDWAEVERRARRTLAIARGG